MTSSHVSAIAALCTLLIAGVEATDYQPLAGSFRPPPIGETSPGQSGFRQDNSQFITTPSQQQAWTSPPYGSSSSYYLTAPQPAPQYQQQNTPNDNWNRSISVNPGNTMNNMFGFGNNNSNNQPNLYQPPVYAQPYQYGSSYPQTYQYGSSYPQTYHYGSSYPQLYGNAAPPIQQPPVAPPSQSAQQPAPSPRRPFGGRESRFRPPELKGTD